MMFIDTFNKQTSLLERIWCLPTGVFATRLFVVQFL